MGKNNYFDDLFVRICKNAIMASIGEDDLFDEDIVTQYLKEVTIITKMFVICNSDEED